MSSSSRAPALAQICRARRRRASRSASSPDSCPSSPGHHSAGESVTACRRHRSWVAAVYRAAMEPRLCPTTTRRWGEACRIDQPAIASSTSVRKRSRDRAGGQRRTAGWPTLARTLDRLGVQHMDRQHRSVSRRPVDRSRDAVLDHRAAVVDQHQRPGRPIARPLQGQDRARVQLHPFHRLTIAADRPADVAVLDAPVHCRTRTSGETLERMSKQDGLTRVGGEARHPRRAGTRRPP